VSEIANYLHLIGFAWMVAATIGMFGALLYAAHRYELFCREVDRIVIGTPQHVQYVQHSTRADEQYTIVTMRDGKTIRLRGIEPIDIGEQVTLKITRFEKLAE